jgi:hypothetical protein
MMYETEYVDPEGRKFRVLLPEGRPEREAYRGVRLGPPDLSSLNYPISVEVRLNNILYARRLLDRATPEQCRDAILSAVKGDGTILAALFA